MNNNGDSNGFKRYTSLKVEDDCFKRIAISNNLLEKAFEPVTFQPLKLLSLPEKINLLKEELDTFNFLVLNREEIEMKEELGNGSFGTVFKAIYNGHLLAMKGIDVSLVFSDASLVRDLIQEIYTSSKLFHDSIPQFKGIVYEDSAFYLCYDCIEGINMKDRCIGESVEFKLDILIQLITILSDLHKLNMIHRDLKPDNTMVTKDNKLYLLDFGTSKIGQTRTRSGKGTTFYMAPENVADGDNNEEDDTKSEKFDDTNLTITNAIDIWSLGCIISEILSDIIPWTNFPSKKRIDDAFILMKLMRKTKFPIPDGLDDKFKTIIGRCVDLDHKNRIVADELILELKAILEKILSEK